MRGFDTSRQSAFLPPSECFKKHQEEGTRFVHASWYHKGNRSGRIEFEEGRRIPNSVYFDLDDVCDDSQRLSHMQPTRELFACAMDQLEIRNDDNVILYGRAGSFFLPRVWFTFRLMGHENIHIMQGSLEDWTSRGGLVDKQPTSVFSVKDLDLSKSPNYKVSYNNSNPKVIGLERMEDIIRKGSHQILDARGSSFSQHGSMPGAINIPYSTLHNGNTFKQTDELRELLLRDNDMDDVERDVVLTCGSGVSACGLYLALLETNMLETRNAVVYDGSWEEWGSLDHTPKQHHQ